MCGIVGVIGEQQASLPLFDALGMLQHRGQEAAGIASMLGSRFFWRKKKGLVSQAFSAEHLQQLPGSSGIAHVRYATAGRPSLSESQPLYVSSPCGLMLAHNGNLTNVEELQQHPLFKNRHINTSSDSELLLNVLAHGMVQQDSCLEKRVFAGVRLVHQLCRGAYSCVALVAGLGLVAFRDPFAIRPLVYGQHPTTKGYMVASESVALDLSGFELLGDIQAGETLLFNKEGAVIKEQSSQRMSSSPCIFEYVYFARPDSRLNNASVYHCRMNAGRLLGEELKKKKIDVDVVIPIPEMGRIAAQEVAQVLQKPLREGFVKNRYVGRSFIIPGQRERDSTVRRKFNPIKSEFAHKKVLLVDDSLVRGTTSKKIVEMVRQLQADKVYFALAAPEVRFPNVYGIDMPTRCELVAFKRNTQEIAHIIGADAVFYLPLKKLHQAVSMENPQLKEFDDAIFSGRYVSGDVDENFLKQLEQRQQQRYQETNNTDNLMVDNGR